MGAATEDQQKLGGSPATDDPGVTALEDAATAPRGKDGRPDVEAGTEQTALDFLLRPPRRLTYITPVKIATEGGDVDVRFVLQSLPGRLLREIERRNTKNEEMGPLAEMDDQRVAAETVAASLTEIRDPATGASLSPRDKRFMVNARGEALVDPADALQARFEFQTGILSSLASEVRRISGWSSDRVGTAQRLMVDAVGSSSSGGD